MGNLKRALFNVYVAVNMLLCAALFFWCAQPRETISGLVGRKASGYDARMFGEPRAWRFRSVASQVWYIGEWLINRLYFWEPDHCRAVSRQETDARKALYS